MNKTLILLLLFLKSYLLSGQMLTKKEAYNFSEQLLEVKILSEKGRQILNQKITADKFERDRRRELTNGGIPVSTDLSAAQILIFLSQAFGRDLYYRSGSVEQNDFLDKLRIERGGNSFTEKDYDFIESKMDSLLQNSVGYQIEMAIPDEESFSMEARTFSISMFDVPLMEEFDVINHSRSVYGKTCTRTLKDLLAIGLISKKVFDEVSKKIQKEELILETYVLAYAAERVIFYEDFEENKLKEKEFIKSLNAKEIISDENLKRLNSDFEKKLFSKYDLIEYANKSKIFYLNQYSANPEIGFAEIFEDIKTIVPEFIFKKFTASVFEEEREWNDDLLEYRARISFEVGGQQYQNEFFYDYKKKENPEQDSILKINYDFHKGINKYLADLNSEYRLYYANKKDREKGAYSEEEFGLILLTEKQFKAWGTSNSDYFLFSQSHNNKFNSKNIKRLIDDYKRIELFNHLSNSEIEKAEDCVLASEIESYQSILSCFPKTIVYFDWESGNLENPYEELTLEIAAASRGVFTPKSIVDDFKDSWKKETVKYAFEFNGKTYQATLKMERDWLDPNFMELIERAMKENEVAGEIYYCLEDGQAAGYIILNKTQYQFLKKNQEALFPEY